MIVRIFSLILIFLLSKNSSVSTNVSIPQYAIGVPLPYICAFVSLPIKNLGKNSMNLKFLFNISDLASINPEPLPPFITKYVGTITILAIPIDIAVYNANLNIVLNLFFSSDRISSYMKYIDINKNISNPI